MKFGLKEGIMAAGMFSAVNEGCAPIPAESESIEVTERKEYDEAVKKCREKFPTKLNPQDQLESEQRLEASFAKEKKDGTPWPGGKIPYVFAQGVPPEAREKILAAMQEWQTKTGKIFFIERTNENSRIIFTDTAKVCSAELGKIKSGGEQYVNLSNPSCYNTPGVVLHELGHTIGLIHEHQRPGWEKNVVMLPENIGEVSNYGSRMGLGEKNPLPYDFDSVMGYNSYGLITTTDGTPPQRAVDPAILRRDTCDVFDTAEVAISPQDVVRVQMLYE